MIHRFATSRDEVAFAELVRRHGGLVRGVARRVLADPHAADDVLQATFLLLATKAGTQTWGHTVGPWLYQSAYRLARKARARQGRRSERPAPIADTPARAADPGAPLAWADVRIVLDEELGRLPAAQRDPLVLCYLEGLTRDEAAAALGCSPGELKGRLERGRKTLRGRLERRGLTLAAGLTAVLAADPRLPTAAAAEVARLAAGGATGGAVPAAVAGLLRTRAGLAVQSAALAAVLVAAALGAAEMTADGPTPPKADNPPLAAPPVAAPRPGTDAHGDPLPAGAIARLGSVRFRPGASVAALAFSPDGKQLASWGEAVYRHGQLSLWDTASGREVRSVRTSWNRFVALAWTPGGRGFVVMKSPRFVNGQPPPVPDLRVWEFTADGPAPPAPDHLFDRTILTGPVTFDAAAASPDGKRLAVAVTSDGSPGKVRVYALGPTESVAGLKPAAEFDAPPVGCKALAFTPDGKLLVGVGPAAPDNKAKDAGTMIVWDAKTGTIARTIAAPAGAAQWKEFNFATTTDRVAVGLGTGDTFVADLRTGTGRTVATGHKAPEASADLGVLALDFAPDGRTLVTAGMGGMVRLWDRAGTKVREFGPHRSWTQAVAFAAGGTRLASGGSDGVIRTWDTTTGKEVGPSGGLPGSVRVLSVSADGATALTESRDEILRVWDARTGVLRRQIPTGGAVAACQLTPDGTRAVALVSGAPDQKLKVWDAATGADVTPVGFPKTIAAGGFQFTPDGAGVLTHVGDQLAAWAWPGGKSSAGPSGTKLWAAEIPKPVKGIYAIDGVTISPDGRHFVTAAVRSWENNSAEGMVDLWDLKTGKRIRRVAEGPSRPAVYARDGGLIVTGATGAVIPSAAGRSATVSADVVVVDPPTGVILREFAPSGRPDGLPSSGYSVVLSADGKVLFRSTAVGEVQAFEVATGQFRAAWPGHRDILFLLAAPAADVRRLVSGSADTTGLVWDVGFAVATPVPLAPERRAALWEDLAAGDAGKGYAAMRALAADPVGFVALAGEKVTPTPPGPSAAEMAAILRDLNSETFATREAASAKLDRCGESAVPLIRVELGKEESAEGRARLLRFLARHTGPPTSGDQLRRLRVVEVLEHLGTVDARRVLTALARGGPSRQTADAAAALERLRGRP
ncbi:hypothetical protein FTUN_5076 [Frigoriglobus tundricola]|uniref:Uncharacterized protein n=1 Tax=Frigoriglobus tundricola TaxID=2774151 RepID=A0A6M5YX30_9BACT|nr:hypothetical protein FTUN_5076 [Frigoriglobus tundricola]